MYSNELVITLIIATTKIKITAIAEALAIKREFNKTPVLTGLETGAADAVLFFETLLVDLAI
jgi:hypothetical protein